MARKKATEPATSDLTFEEAHALLEATIRNLETGNLNLQDATRLYEEGIQLAQRCNELLTQTELRIGYLETHFGRQMGLTKEDLE